MAELAYAAIPGIKCRGCGEGDLRSVLDLGVSPLANAYRTREQLQQPEYCHPLHALLCEKCWLMQLSTTPPPEEMFRDYRYFSSYSATMLAHAESYAAMAAERFSLNEQSLVVEIASNDGYLLQHFRKRNIPVLGIEPAQTVAKAAREKHGIETVTRFFNRALAEELKAQGRMADLMIANNVLAHVPEINDFLAGIALLLKEKGIATVEFPDLANLLAQAQFDTIYHEHCYYLSLAAAKQLFARAGLEIFKAEPVAVHGGSLRVHAAHPGAYPVDLPDRQETLAPYAALKEKAYAIKRALLTFLIEAKNGGRQVAAYGAAAKGNTLLNFCGIRGDLIDYAADISPHKQGLYLPGSQLPIHSPEDLRRTRPDYVLILPWNLKDEIIAQHAYIREWGGRFVTAVPALTIE